MVRWPVRLKSNKIIYVLVIYHRSKVMKVKMKSLISQEFLG